jgi:hypothetical protein
VNHLICNDNRGGGGGGGRFVPAQYGSSCWCLSDVQSLVHLVHVLPIPTWMTACVSIVRGMSGLVYVQPRKWLLPQAFLATLDVAIGTAMDFNTMQPHVLRMDVNTSTMYVALIQPSMLQIKPLS